MALKLKELDARATRKYFLLHALLRRARYKAFRWGELAEWQKVQSYRAALASLYEPDGTPKHPQQSS